MDRSLGLAICSATTTCPLWNCRWCAPGPIFGSGPGVSGGLFGMAVSHPLDPGALTKITAWKGGDVCQGKRGCKENDKRAADCCFRAIETKRTRLCTNQHLSLLITRMPGQSPLWGCKGDKATSVVRVFKTPNPNTQKSTRSTLTASSRCNPRLCFHCCLKQPFACIAFTLVNLNSEPCPNLQTDWIPSGVTAYQGDIHLSILTQTSSSHAPLPFISIWENHSLQCLPQWVPPLPFSFVCQPTYKTCPKRFPWIVVMLSWCGAGSPAVLPSAFAPPALCSQSAAFPTTPGKSRRWIHRQIFSRFFHRCFSYGSSFSNIFHRLSGPAPPFPAIMARTRHMTAQARSTATNSSPPRPRPPPTPVAGQGRDASSTPQHARVAIPDPVAMGGSPSMMERFFPTGLPRRYTSQAEAVPSSIGSVISSSQERYGTLNLRMLPACEARKGLVVRWPGTGRMKEMGG